MYSSFFIAIILLFIQSISGQYAEDNRVIIGSSIGGLIGLVSFIIFQNKKTKNFYLLNNL
jgi:hypothetical protein